MTAGTVYDRGYRSYDGPRGGRGAARAALYRASLRQALGIRRSWRQKLVPLGLLGVTLIPALIDVAIAYATRHVVNAPRPISYRDYVGISSTLLVFVAVVAPDLVCPDRRQNVLALILARPLTGFDYALAKTGALCTVLLAFALAPHLVLYASRLLLSDDVTGYVRDNGDVLWQVPAATAALALFYGVLGIAIASLTGRRAVAAAGIIGTSLVSGIVSQSLLAAADRGRVAAAGASAVDVAGLPIKVRDLLFLGHTDPTSPASGAPGAGTIVVAAYVAVLLLGVGVLAWRHRPGAS
jgi:ABC-2 type transport system permease protein